MITIAKLNSLKDRTCVRKTALLFHQSANLALQGNEDRTYIQALTGLFSNSQFTTVLDGPTHTRLLQLASALPGKTGRELALLCDDIHYLLLAALGSDPSDWDFVDAQGQLDPSKRRVLDHILVLDRLRSPYNVGSIFRSADSFGVKKIYLVEGSANVEHPRTDRTSRGCTHTVDYEILAEDALVQALSALNLPIFALETGGTNLQGFAFPQKGVGIIGGEELGVSPQLLNLCDASLGRVTIEQGGTKGSLNVAVAAGIMMHGWYQA